LLVLCFGVLTFDRALDWRSTDTLYEDGLKQIATPRSRVHLADVALEEAQSAYDRIQAGDRDPALRETLLKKTDRVFALADEQMFELEHTLRIEPGALGGLILSKAANALVLLGRNGEAYSTAKRAVACLGDAVGVEPHPHYNVALAARRLGLGLIEGVERGVGGRAALVRAADYLTEAAEELTRARQAGYSERDLRETIAANFAAAATVRVRAIGAGATGAERADLAARAGFDFLRAAAVAEEMGNLRDARLLYRKSLEWAPGEAARAALRRLGR
jgi:hypothetical protein